MSDGSHLIAHGISGEILLAGILHTGDGSIAETMIGEDRAPRLAVLLTIADIDILREGIAEVVEIQTAVSLQFLGIFHTDGITLPATDLKPIQPAMFCPKSTMSVSWRCFRLTG